MEIESVQKDTVREREMWKGETAIKVEEEKQETKRKTSSVAS